MSLTDGGTPERQTACLLVHDPSGKRSRVVIDPLPFHLGRQAQNHLVLRDARISREHARIVADQDGYAIEDRDSLNGVFVNGERVTRRRLAPSDQIEFGVPDSYRLVFSQDASIERLADHLVSPVRPGGNLARLRAVVELARALETSLSTTDLLAALVDAALAITGAERAFLLLRQGEELEFRVARDSRGMTLAPEDLRVPTAIIHKALTRRRELLSMSFDPHAEDSGLPSSTVAELELRSVVCVPLIKIRVGGEETSLLPVPGETLGVLYLDTRAGTADLSAGNRELLHTLALEASTVLENARLLEGERARQRLEEELKIAREIQASLLPRSLPHTGWLRAAGRSIPSHHVGGDYFDVRRISPTAWSLINADVSGKGVSAALLASLLQGMFLAAPYSNVAVEEAMARINGFLLEQTGGEKYATIFFGILARDGLLRYVNAGHGIALLARAAGGLERLEPTGVPVGLLPEAAYEAGEARLADGDKLVLYTDGFTEAANPDGRFFGEARLREIVRAGAAAGAQALFDALDSALAEHTEGTVQKDDITFMTVEYRMEED